MSAADEARAALFQASTLDVDDEQVMQELARAQVWATLAVAEAIKDGIASTMYTGK